jgi:hypothetical protein
MKRAVGLFRFALVFRIRKISVKNSCYPMNEAFSLQPIGCWLLILLILIGLRDL